MDTAVRWWFVGGGGGGGGRCYTPYFQMVSYLYVQQQDVYKVLIVLSCVCNPCESWIVFRHNSVWYFVITLYDSFQV